MGGCFFISLTILLSYLAGSKPNHMPSPKKVHPPIKSKLHPRSKHRERYDLTALIASHPPLKAYVAPNIHGDESIDFFDPIAVKTLNTALLKHHYGVQHWDIPIGYLCPPIPGRMDYLHYAADLLMSHNNGVLAKNIKCMDIGCGANCIYPMLGASAYGWSFIASELDEVALTAAQKNIDANIQFKDKVELRLQTNPNDLLFGALKRNELVDLVICNPPFHESKEASEAATLRKLRNLKSSKIKEVAKNFGGKSNELWCEGGEKRFIKDLIYESKTYANNCFWFTSLVSEKALLPSLEQSAKFNGATEVVFIPMGQGNKTSQVVAWTFLNKKQQKAWVESRWS